jgi:hypothetical protein
MKLNIIKTLLVIISMAFLSGIAITPVSTVAQDAAKREFRDWKMFPPVVELDTSEDIIALGDVHGDYDRFYTLLFNNRVISGDSDYPEKIRWKAGKSVFICTGDVIDRYPQALKVIKALQAMEESAKAQGGKVFVTMGNHEATFLGKPHDKHIRIFTHELIDHSINPDEVAAGSVWPGPFLRSLPFAVRLRDWFFVHAGDTEGLTVRQLTDKVESEVNVKGILAPILLGHDSILKSAFKPAPWWENKGRDPMQTLENYTRALGVHHIVMGHHPGEIYYSDHTQREKGVVSHRYGLLFFTDVGMSRPLDFSQGALLRIHGTGNDTKATVLFPDKEQKVIWP